MAEENNSEVVFGRDKKSEAPQEDFPLIDEGSYEVVLEDVEEKKSAKGYEYLKLRFCIRTDVEQKFKNRKLWYTIFKRDGDKAYNFNAFNELILTQEGTPNYKDHFGPENIKEEILQYVIGLHMRVDVGIELNKATSKDDNIIVAGTFAPSIWDVSHPKTADADPNPNMAPIDDVSDDLPF